MGDSLASLGPAVANHLWQSTACAVVAWAVTLLLRRNQARVRYGVWLAASVKFVVPFALLMAVGGMLPRPRHAVVTMPVYSAVDEVGLPFEDMAMPAAGSSVVATESVRKTRGERFEEFATAPVMLTAVWLCGMVVVLAMWGRRWMRVVGTLRRAEAAYEGRELEILRRVEAMTSGTKAPRVFGSDSSMAEAIRLSPARQGSEVEPAAGRGIELRLSAESMEPGIFGVFRPVLIWPRGLSERLSDAHIEAILAHELMHVRRRDNLTAALHMLVEAVFWFHPVVWWMGARLVEERERACDEAVVEMGSRPGVYAESLLKAVRFCVESPVACVAGVTGADLKQRVRSIMTLRLRRMGALGTMALAALAVGMVLGPVAFGVVRMIPLVGQVFQATGPLPSYEFVVIKPSQEEAHGASTEGDTTHYGLTAKMLIQFAYSKFGPKPTMIDLKVVGGPDWINTDVFSIVGKMSSTEYQQEQGLGRQQRLERRQMMEQSILADRFRLKMHTEMQDQPVYALTVTKPGKLHEAKDATGTFRFNPFPSDTSPDSITRGLVVNRVGGHLKMTAKGMSLVELVNALSSQKETNGEHVVDQTGLTGAYDFTLTWGPPDNAGAAESGEVEEPPLFVALQQQLGLKLAPAKAPAEVVVIDHIEKPEFDKADVETKPSVMTTALAEGQRLLANLLPAAMVQEKAIPSAANANVAFDPCARADGAQFDVISIKPSKQRSGDWDSDAHDDFVSLSGSVEGLIEQSFGLRDFQVSGGPEWVRGDTFDIQAKFVPDAREPDRKTVVNQWKERYRSLLSERFQFRCHMTTRDLPVYDLVLSKGGAKMKPTAPGSAGSISGRGDGRKTVDTVIGASALDIAALFAGYSDRPVVDKTGLTGKYDFVLNWSTPKQAELSQRDGEAPKPELAAAIEEQLGLKLVASKGPVPVLVIDHLEKPLFDNAEVQPAHLVPAAYMAAGQAPATMPTTQTINPIPAPIDAVPAKINFDVVSFKLCPPGKYGTTKVDMPMTGDYLAYHCEPLSRIIYFAYNGSVKVYSLESGYPKWVDEDSYEFEVKVAPEDIPAWQKLNITERRILIRNVLADAVKLKIRIDTSPKPIYALTAMKKIKMTPFKPGDETKLPDGRVQQGTSHLWTNDTSYYQGFTMAGLAEIYSTRMDRVIADQTNLTGQYTFTTPVFGGVNMEPDSPISPREDAPTVEDVLEQLGLRLKATTGPVERLVIDHIERPSTN